ncbi:MAG: FAD-binding oxidoreductase [Rhizobiaceae bacterium]
MKSPYFIYGERKSAKPEPAAPAREARPMVSLPPLPTIAGAVMVTPSHPDYGALNVAHNKRNYLQPPVQPALRIMCTSTQAVADSVNWVRNNNLPLALRSGGHCYEGFSQSGGVVIDVRRMGLVTVDTATQTVTVSAGASLWKIYSAVAAAGFAFAGGSCPTVGIAGHALGGGMGLLGRRYGLACDNMLGVRLVKADGSIVEADASNAPDIYWASRGGGGGSFGVATRFRFKIHPLTHVKTFTMTWNFANTSAELAKARKVFNAWQNWAPNAPNDITAIMTVQRVAGNKLRLRCIGQTTASGGTNTALLAQLANLTSISTPASGPAIVKRTFIGAVTAFAGGLDYETIYMDAKSDFVLNPLSTAAINQLFASIMSWPAGNVAALCDAYGGAIAQLAPNATAFPYRAPGTYSIQYYSRWTSGADSPTRLARLAQVYASMAPFRPASAPAYVNYCDTGLGASYATSYWAGNVTQLHTAKLALDPGNLFQHGQSVT